MAENLYRRGATWWGRVQAGGREHRRSLRTGNRTEARKRLAAWKAEIARAGFYGDARLTWEAATLRYVVEVMPGAVKPSTAKRYLVSFRQVARHLDGLHVDAIGRREIAAMIAKRRAEGALNATVRRDLTAVSRVFASAIAAGLCERNPALEYDRGMVRERRDPVSLPTDAEIHAALAACPSDAFRRIVAFAAQTGMRQAEILSLRWGQIDLARGVATLDRTKTDQPRIVPLSPAAVGTLAGTPRHAVEKLVFWHGAGRPYRNFPSQFAAWRRSRGVAFRFHDLRHFFAVEYLRTGGNIYDLQRVLGHASIKTTELYLAYLAPAERRESTAGPAQNPAQI